MMTPTDITRDIILRGIKDSDFIPLKVHLQYYDVGKDYQNKILNEMDLIMSNKKLQEQLSYYDVDAFRVEEKTVGKDKVQVEVISVLTNLPWLQLIMFHVEFGTKRGWLIKKQDKHWILAQIQLAIFLREKINCT